MNAGLDIPPFLQRVKIVYSYTNLNLYDSICPHQFQRRFITKDIPFTETPALKHGIQVHTAMEQRIAGGKPLPDAYRHWEPLAEPLARRKAKAEMQLAVDRQGKPVDFWGKGKDVPFIRGKADAVVLNGSRAYIADFKTGKKREDPFELEVQAMLLKAQFPQLGTIIATYIWLKDSDVGQPHDVSNTGATFAKCSRIAQDIEQDRVYEKRSGPLCKWCDVVDCEYNRKET